MVKNRVNSSFAEVKFMNIGLYPYRKGSGRVCTKLSRESPLGGGTWVGNSGNMKGTPKILACEAG